MSSDAALLRQHREKHRGFYIVASSLPTEGGGDGYRCNCLIFRSAANSASFNCDMVEAVNTPEAALLQGVDRAKVEIDRRLEEEVRMT